MSITTSQLFQRIHCNGTVLFEVPAGTTVRIDMLYGNSAWRVTASEPVGKFGEKSFCVNATEYNILVGAQKKMERIEVWKSANKQDINVYAFLKEFEDASEIKIDVENAPFGIGLNDDNFLI